MSFAMFHASTLARFATMFCAVIAAAMLAAPARAELKLPAIISDNCVLQQGRTVPIWGWAEAGEEVTVTIAGQSLKTTAGPNRRWQVMLAPLKVTSDPIEMTVTGNKSAGPVLTVKNVLVGEVWIGSGQSNMAMNVRRSWWSTPKVAAANYPKIRLFTVGRRVVDKVYDDLVGRWVECSPQTVGDFSAVAYFFGQELHELLGQPFGLICCAYGASPVEAWMSHETLQSDPAFAPVYPRWEAQKKAWSEELRDYSAALKAWQETADAATAAGQKPSGKPKPPIVNRQLQPSGCYNGMLRPLQPYAFRGVLWYQGEANTRDHDDAQLYRRLFPALVKQWRQEWGQGEFPFYYVQLANFHPMEPEPGESLWAEVRESQELSLAAMANSVMAVIIDLGEADDIHPKRKLEVAHRLAQAAKALVYEQKETVYQSPMFDSLAVEGDRLRVKFKNVGGGLVVKAPPAPDAKPLPKGRKAPPQRREMKVKGFAVAGADRKFVWAEGRIEGDSVVVWNEAVKEPKFVRYAWADNPEFNLFSAEGLPAGPFRSDR